jgi:hypothetical protein
MCKLENGLQVMTNNGYSLFLIKTGEGNKQQENIDKILNFVKEEIEEVK